MSRSNGRYNPSIDKLYADVDYLRDRTSRTEDAITKLVDVGSNVSRLLAVHDEKIETTAKIVDKFDIKLDSLSKEMKERDDLIVKQIHDKIDTTSKDREEKYISQKQTIEKVDEKVGVVKKTIDKFVLWGYFIAGGIFCLSVVFPNFELIKKILALIVKL